MSKYIPRINLLYEEFEDTKGVIIIRKLKERQHNGQNKKTSNDLQGRNYH
jgi:hypothetical protein